MASPTPPASDSAATLQLPVVPSAAPQMPAPMRPTKPVIEVCNVSKKIGDVDIVHDLSFDVEAGEIFGFIGPSGSGKTTTIRLLTGAYGPTEGEVRVMGIAPSHPSRRVQEQFGYMPQLFVLYPNLTVQENLQFVASLYGMSPKLRQSRITELLKFVELWDARHRVASNVSGGMQRRIELAAALLHNPPLVFADEPTAGIDPVLRGKFWEEFRRLRDEGRTLFVTTQYVGESEYCDRVAVIRKGRLIAVDTPIGLRRRAFGGDMLDIEATGLTSATVHSLTQLDMVKEVQPISRRQIRVSVDESGPAIPAVLDVLSTCNCTVARIEEYRPNFDEVFIVLMQQDAAERGESETNDDE